MRILIAHNAYQQRGGEDAVVEAEIALLREHGHEVLSYTRHNDELGRIGKLSALKQTLWSGRTTNEMSAQISQDKPDVIHVHNTFPLVSPSIYWAAARAKVPVVQTLHNFRLLCPQAMFLRQGHVCEDCLGGLPWRGVVRKCYRGSVAQSAALAGMLTMHRAMGTYQDKVACYIALNEFCKNKFIEGGLPADKIMVKPNFVEVSPCEERVRAGGLFVGRLSPEKGIDVLLDAAMQCVKRAIRVVGSGPESRRVESHPGVISLGWKTQRETLEEMQRASYLVMPSLWYENFPRTLVEAFACGLPVIASRMGAMVELIKDGRTGLLFDPGSAEDLSKKIAWAEANSTAMREMGKNARNEYEEKYTPEQNYQHLMAIYKKVS